VKTPQQPPERCQPPASYPGEDTKFASRRETILLEAERIAKMGSYEWDVRTGNVFRSEELCRIFGVTLEQFKPSFEGVISSASTPRTATTRRRPSKTRFAKRFLSNSRNALSIPMEPFAIFTAGEGGSSIRSKIR
jgi:hypothetical protein